MIRNALSLVALAAGVALVALTAHADSTIAPPALAPATSGQPLGEGQTWHAVGRAKNVAYTNTMGRPIMVMCSMSLQSGGNNAYFYIDGALVGHHGNGSSTDHSVTWSYVIPAGSYYMITGTGWRTNIDTCAELY